MPHSMAIVTLLQVQEQDNVFASNSQMSDFVCLPLKLPDVRFQLRAPEKAKVRKHKDLYATLPIYAELVDSHDVRWAKERSRP